MKTVWEDRIGLSDDERQVWKALLSLIKEVNLLKEQSPTEIQEAISMIHHLQDWIIARPSFRKLNEEKRKELIEKENNG